MKLKRHNAIIELITKYDIDTQDGLITKLSEKGFDVTQATVSRDIRDLKLVKIATSDHKYKYALSQKDDIEISDKYRNIVKETLIRVDHSNSFVVLHTYSGMAQAAAAAIDGMCWDEIVGTIAGDDTIFVLMRDNSAAIEFAEKLRQIAKGK